VEQEPVALVPADTELVLSIFEADDVRSIYHRVFDHNYNLWVG
jgi:hypothetical protein